jgi:mRNA-degrading endonuclease toxin of MazEF toxin-antitoxin module
VPFPEPVPGLVIRYAYLWWREYERGREEGVKDRPCAVVMTATGSQGNTVVTVLPITHTPPSDAALAVEIPHVTKQRLGLDSARSWVLLTEANRFAWPGPDLRMKEASGPESVAYGLLPRALFREIAGKFADAIEVRLAHVVRRTQ